MAWSITQREHVNDWEYFTSDFLAANVSMGGKHQLLAAARQFTVIQEYAWAIGRIMAPYQPDGCILVASMEF